MRDFRENDLSPCIMVIYNNLGRNDAFLALDDFWDEIISDTKDYAFLKRKVVTYKRDVIGICGLYRLKTHPKNSVSICWFAVEPKYQNRGIGTRLINWCISEAKRNRNKSIFVWSTFRAAPFYYGLGFRKSQTVLAPKEGDVLYVKKLK